MKLSNTARSISEIALQASVFIPMAIPSGALPSYVMLDPHSQWHVSGLLSTAMESMSLPSRLKIQDSARQTFDQLSNALNVNGHQTITKLRMSVDQKTSLNGHGQSAVVEEGAQIPDSRIPPGNGHAAASSNEEEEKPKIFDMDFFPTETGEQPRGHRTKKPHVFGQTENFRSDHDLEETNIIGDDGGHERARRRAAGLSITQRLVPALCGYSFRTLIVVKFSNFQFFRPPSLGCSPAYM